MPQQAQNNMKGTSPSKLVQHGVDTDWAAQQKATTDPAQALSQKHTNNPMPVSGTDK